jgi:formylglycine-generating enzyme required for sulfatase activity
MPLTLRRTPRTAQGFVEPLLAVGEAIPLHMVLIPGGSFLMGQTEAEKAELIRQAGEEDYERYCARELPQHEVTGPSFMMGRYPVTQAQWRAVAALP